MTPKFRYPNFSSDWKCEQLNKLTSYVDYRGKTPVKTSSGVFLVTAKNIRMGYVDYESSKEYVSKDDYPSVMSRGKPLAGDVVITTEAPMGNVATITRTDIALAQRVIKLRGLDGLVDNSFLSYRLQSPHFQNELRSKASGGTVKGIKGGTLHKIKISFPSFEEQQQIASFLSLVDKKISLLTQEHELLTTYKKGVMQKIFNQEIRFKNNEGCNYPEWLIKKVEEIGYTFNGLVGKSANDFGTGSHYISYKQIFDGSKIDVTKCPLVKIQPGEKQSQVKYGDALFTTSSETPDEVGYCSVLLENVDDVYLNSFSFGFRFHSFDLILPEFARFLFFSESFRKQVILLAQGITRYNISKGGFLKIQVNLACIEEQKKIASFLSELEDKIALTQKQIDLTKQYKQGLLQQMFV